MFIHCPTQKHMFVCRENCGSGTSQWAPVGDKRLSTKIIPCTQRKSWFGEVYIRHNCSNVSVMPRQEYPNIWKSSLKFGWFCFLFGTLILFYHFSNTLTNARTQMKSAKLTKNCSRNGLFAQKIQYLYILYSAFRVELFKKPIYLRRLRQKIDAGPIISY